MNVLLIGILLISLSSLANGVFSIPLGYRRRYAVENMWVLVFSLGYAVIGQALACALAPGWASAVGAAGSGTVWLAVAMGMGWGLASVCFSQAISRVGVSLGFAMIMGLIMVTGTVVPLANHWSAVSAAGRWLTLGGMALAVVGVSVSGKAGVLRDRDRHMAAPQSHGKGLAAGLVFCVLAGLLSACSNIGYEFSAPVADEFVRAGGHPIYGSLVRWLPLYWGGSGMVLVISAVQLTCNRTWGRFRGPGAGRDFALTLVMVAIISLTLLPYGVGAYYMGELGTSVGYAMSMILALVIANIAGVLAGEWRGAGRTARWTLLTGLACLVVASALLGWAAA